VATVVAAVVLAACGGGEDAADDSTADGSVAAVSDAATGATDTASASTVVPPSLAPACVVASMMFIPAGTGAVQVMNHATSQCELDLTGTPALSPESEPTVWIDSGATAELQIEAAESCATPTENLSLMVSGAPFEVTLVEPTCAPTIVAVYPLD